MIKQGYEPNLILVGKKAIGYFQNRKDRYVIKSTFKELEQVPTAIDSEGITNDVLAEFFIRKLRQGRDYIYQIHHSGKLCSSCANIVAIRSSRNC